MTSTRKLAAVAALLFLLGGGGWALSIVSSTPSHDAYCASEKSSSDAAKANRDRLEQEWRNTDISLGREDNWKRNPRYDEVYSEYNQSKQTFTDAAARSGECWNRWNTIKGESAAKGGLAGGLAFLALPLLVFAFWDRISAAASRASDAAATRSAELKAAAEVKRAERQAEAEVRKADRKAEAEVRRAEREAAAEQRRAEAAARLADAQARAAAQPQPSFAGQSHPAAPQYQQQVATPVYEYPETDVAANPAYAGEQFSSPAPQPPSTKSESTSVSLDDLLDGKLGGG